MRVETELSDDGRQTRDECASWCLNDSHWTGRGVLKYPTGEPQSPEGAHVSRIIPQAQLDFQQKQNTATTPKANKTNIGKEIQ